ncbi:hypothetical protein CWE13_07440 [Aliidiomarina shirensis]|uniref:Uncharacterized protein n=1 Tax=Aliidiomarina shirensis TaxID=1048642 RepID=A0A432WVH0_9GAMM|nr:hypothetical protein [Aliidiomarina shirensis]RUO37770.1 hypothetical protein CWE13_07440 [Aliidiomarina shirensis]
MNIVLKNKNIVQKLELLMKCASKFSESKTDIDHKIALHFNSVEKSVTCSTHILAKPAQAKFAEFVYTPTRVSKNFSIELSALSLYIAAKKLSDADFLDIEIDFNKTTLHLFGATSIEPDLVTEEQLFQRIKSKARYNQRFTLLDNTAPYDLDYDSVIGYSRKINRQDALAMGGAIKILNALTLVRTATIAVEANAIYAAYFYSALSNAIDDSKALAVFNYESFNVLSILAGRFTQRDDAEPELVISNKWVLLRLGHFVVKLQTMDMGQAPQMMSPKHLQYGAVAFSPKSALQALDDVDICETSNDNRLVIMPVSDDELGIALLTEKATSAESAFKVNCAFSAIKQKVAVPHQLLVEAINFLALDEVAFIFGLETTSSSAICISNEAKTRYALVVRYNQI